MYARQAAVVLTGVPPVVKVLRIVPSLVVQNNLRPVTPGLTGAEPMTNVSLMPPPFEIPVALNTYPLLPVLPMMAVDSGSGIIHADVLDCVQGSAPPKS